MMQVLHAHNAPEVAVSAALAGAGMPWVQMPFTRESWAKEFPDNWVKTALGEVQIRPENMDIGEADLLGIVRPTLEDPALVVRDDRGLIFHRAITGPQGEYRGYATVRLDGDRVTVRTSAAGEIPACLLDAVGGSVTADVGEDGDVIFKAATLVSLGSSSKGSTQAELELLEPEPCLGSITVLSFDLAAACLGWGGDFFKSDISKIPPGARWITVHPNGGGSKGTPVLVEPAKDGSGHMRVIAGAGGKLNMLKLRGVKDPAEYREGHAERASAKRERSKEQIRQDKELGLHDAKHQARKNLQEQKRTAQRAFIKTVAAAMGWTDEALQPQTEGLSPAAKDKLEKDWHRDLLAKAKGAVSTQRKVLAADAERRAQAGLDTVPLESIAEQLSAQDLDPVRPTDTSGINPQFGARAEANGLTDEVLASKVAETHAKAADPAAAAAKQSLADQIAEELKDHHAPQLQTSIVEADKAVALIKAHKQLQAIETKARAAAAEVDASLTEPKAYVLTVSDEEINKAALATVENDLMAVRNHAFLAGMGDVGGEDAVEHHIATGAYNAINAVSQVVGGASLLDRSVVDVLGIAASAQLLARRFTTDHAGDVGKIRDAVAEHHVSGQAELQEAALDEAKALQTKALEIEQSEAASASDLAVATALNLQREEYLGQARKVMGQALGEMEAHASLVAALDGKPADHLDVSLGKTSPESAIKQLFALGLDGKDFDLQKVEGNTFVKINAAAMDKLAAPVDHEGLEKVRRNLAIMNGAEDEDDWLPDGFARRADLGLNLAPGVAPQLAEPFKGDSADLGQALKAYIGGRTADGDRAADILADVQSASFFQKAGAERSAEYRAALDSVIPTKDGKKQIRVETLEPLFNQYADAHVEAKWGGKRSTLNKQAFEPDALAQEALHRALADEPTGTVAYKPIGDLTLKDRGALRNWFLKNVAKESPQEAELREGVDKLAANEPDKFETDFFGATSVSPSWTEWKGDFDAAKAKLSAVSLDWNRYAKAMGGKVRALEAVQDLIRSKVSGNFAEHHNTLKPQAALKVGKTVIRHNLNHLGAVDPDERAKRLSQEKELIDGLRNRIGGKYASGSVSDKLDATKEHEAAMGQAQMGFFSSEDLPEPGADNAKAMLGGDERHTIGHAAEGMLAKMMGPVGKQFEPGKPVKLFKPSMSGKDGIKRQRMIKLIAENKRVIGAAGVGSGKTAIGLGAFSHLHAAGKAKKGLYIVPSIVQEQFGGEALRFLDPGKFKWHAQPGASHEERMAHYKDPETHFSVVTHQSFRDDVLKMGAAAGLGANPEAVAQHLASLDNPGRAAAIKGVLEHHGINHDFVMADEGHGLLDREGKDDSRMSQAIAGVTDNAEYYFHASGDPIKNDASEAFSVLQKMDPARYTDRSAFMRRYGGDTAAAAQGLKREMARHAYAFSLSPDVKVNRSEHKVEPSAAQHAALAGVDKDTAALRIAGMTGKADVEAAKRFSPAMFAGASPEQEEEIAGKVAKSVGILRSAAVRRVLDTHPAAAKLDQIVKEAGARKGKQGVVFARSLAAVEMIRQRLEAEGHKVVVLTGKDSAKEKGAKIQKFRPDKGEPEADIIVCSDAGATGANLQSGHWLAQYDTPDTAMTHRQRQGRIDRIGQHNDIDLVDLVSDHPDERRARKRLLNKYELRNLMTSELDGLDDSGLAYHLAQTGFGASKSAQGSLL
jgi:hypothetical protein